MLTTLTFLLLVVPADAGPAAEEALQELQAVVDHIAAVEAVQEDTGPPAESASAEMASICYSPLEGGQLRLEHCSPAESQPELGPAAYSDLATALAAAPEPYRELSPAMVLPCEVARLPTEEAEVNASAEQETPRAE